MNSYTFHYANETHGYDFKLCAEDPAAAFDRIRNYIESEQLPLHWRKHLKSFAGIGSNSIAVKEYEL